jgi:hypothetical protein
MKGTDRPSATQSTSTALRPNHYAQHDPEPITVIERWRLGFHLGNVVKYLIRAPHKENELRDLRKARWYLDRWIQVRTAELEGAALPTPDPQTR